MEKEKDKYKEELRGFKERCKQLEMELEQTRGFENSSMFGTSQLMMNTTSATGMNPQSKKNDYELKQLKEVYDKKLAKSNEELQRKSSQVKDLENEVAKAREEIKKM